jgi:hypothetical protein
MKTYYLSGTELSQVLEGLEKKFKVPFETWDCRDGCLLDNYIGSFYMEGCNPFTMMVKEHYLNPNSSDYCVTIARTEGDNRKIDKLWNEFITAYDEDAWMEEGN